MTSIKRKYRTIYLVTAALMVAMIGGYTLAASSLTTTGPGQTTNVTITAPAGFATATVTSWQLVVLTAAMTGATVAGTNVATSYMAATPTALAACAANPCAVQTFRSGNPGTETTADYGEQIVLSVSQPLHTGTASGFDLSIGINWQTGTGVMSNVSAQAYFSTGLGTAGAVTVPVYLFVDLLSTNAPILNSISIVFNTCSSATACP